ncbi:MAG TPA: hypothetical protein VFC73_06395, partial [Syntrophomonadaceae bacterium]|nr:hypothetical protein [Syntrophomonadaceae bacterium]
GTAESALYADAAAVMAELPSHVSAEGGMVSVPVVQWLDTDTYDPNTAGSYTFTAVLGEIPDGYANTGNHTATIEVIIASNPMGKMAGADIEKLEDDTDLTPDSADNSALDDPLAGEDAGTEESATDLDTTEVIEETPSDVAEDNLAVSDPVEPSLDTDNYDPDTEEIVTNADTAEVIAGTPSEAVEDDLAVSDPFEPNLDTEDYRPTAEAIIRRPIE